MRRPSQLAFGDGAHAFRTRDAVACGVTPDRLRASDLQRPFHGIRSRGLDLDDHLDRCRALAPRLKAGTHFSHTSAALLHELPLPRRYSAGPVHISVFEPDRAPKLRGVTSHEVAATGQLTTRVRSLPVIAPADTWVQLASGVPLDDLVVVGDYLITGSEPFTGARPPCTREDLESAIRRQAKRRGVARARAALDLVRYGPLSPQESRLRLLMGRAGLPAPELNFRVRDIAGKLVAMVDLAIVGSRVAVEYQGSHHRTDNDVYHSDIGRRERLEGCGWKVIYVVAADLTEHPEQLIARIWRAHEKRG
jgi:very-short-patch-repair endonuclease